MNKRALAKEILKLAKSLVAEDTFFVTLHEQDEDTHQWYPAGKYMYRDLSKAFKEAESFMRELSDHAVVIYSGDTLYGYGGRGMNQETAMKVGTGTINRLTKSDKRVRFIHSS